MPDGLNPTPVVYATWAESTTPPGHDVVHELYDPVFVLLDQQNPEGRISIYNGNAWRLASVVKQELTVLGRRAWLSDLPNGAVIVDFRVADTGSGCDFWAISGVEVDEAELRAFAESLTLNP